MQQLQPVMSLQNRVVYVWKDYLNFFRRSLLTPHCLSLLGFRLFLFIWFEFGQIDEGNIDPAILIEAKTLLVR